MLSQNPAAVKMLANPRARVQNGCQARPESASRLDENRYESTMLHQFPWMVVVALCTLMPHSPAQEPDLATLQRQAQAGDAKAQFELANAYSQKDPAKAADWLRKSARQDYAGAEVTLGYFYQKGSKELGIPQDSHQAALWYRKAARQSAKDAKHAQKAKDDLSAMRAQGLISSSEADWRTSENNSSASSQTKSKKAQSFSLAEVETGIAGGITNKRMATLVATYGVNFPLSEDARKRLSSEGADDNLLNTIATSKH